MKEPEITETIVSSEAAPDETSPELAIAGRLGTVQYFTSPATHSASEQHLGVQVRVSKPFNTSHALYMTQMRHLGSPLPEIHKSDHCCSASTTLRHIQDPIATCLTPS